MADLKISQLTGATTPLAGTEVLPIVQSGATKQVSVANLTAGRTQTSNGIVQGSAATGYNFTANTPAAGMTSQLLNWYEEGTWTPGQGGGVTVVGSYSSSGTYTRIGRQVTVNFKVSGSTSIAVNSGSSFFTGLPFAGLSGGFFSAAISEIANASSVVSAKGTFPGSITETARTSETIE